MESRLDYLFQEWAQWGGEVLLAQTDHTLTPREPEAVIAESTAHCRESGWLMWVVLDWLIQHVDQIDEHKVLENTKQVGDLSVLGLLCDAAHERSPNEKFLRILRECKPHQPTEIFFYRVVCSALASQIARDNALHVFRRWGYLSNELEYLRDEKRVVE